MSFWPLPPVAWCHIRASSAAGLRCTSCRRVASSHAAAPASRPSMSSPCSAAGSRPTADSTLVRPPTQSHIGKRASQPSDSAVRSSCEPGLVMATACCGKLEARALRYASATSSMPLRVSGVPPLLEVTTQSVSPSCPAKPSQRAGDAVGVGVVDEVDLHPVAGRDCPGRRRRTAGPGPSRRCRWTARA